MKKFASCLNCMDGRVQLPTVVWIKENYKIDYVDVITEAGMDGILANESVNIDSILQKVDISIDKHKANNIFIIGHYDCAGNPVDEKTHKKHIRKGVERLKSLRPFCKVIGLWVSEQWLAERIIEL